MNDKVIDFPGSQFRTIGPDGEARGVSDRLDPATVLQAALDHHLNEDGDGDELEEVLVIGRNRGGGLFVAGNKPSIPSLFFLMDQAKFWFLAGEL